MLNDIWKITASPRMAVAIALFLTSVVTACDKPAKSSPIVTIEHQITPEPVRVGLATLTLKLADAGRQPITGANITVEGNMSHAGMAPVFAQAKETEQGRYRATLDLTMAGDWTILIHATLAGGQKLERQLDVKGVRPN